MQKKSLLDENLKIKKELTKLKKQKTESSHDQSFTTMFGSKSGLEKR